MNEKIAVIGGGPAGIIAAGTIGSRGKDVTLIEKNEKLGKKLFITGKGRCNITNAAPIDELFDYINTNKNFLYSSLYTFTNDNIIELLENFGLKTKVERGNRVFPASDKSSDVIKALEKFLKKNNVRIMLNSKVDSIVYRKKNKSFVITIGEKDHEFDKVVIATGGVSYPTTGSTGDGFTFAKRMGHNIIPLKPSLVPIEIDAEWIKDLQGVSLKNVNLSAYSGKKLLKEEFGEMIFTHHGISGPIVLSISNGINKYINKDLRMEIDFKPALSIEKLNNRLLRDFEQYSNKQLKNALNDLLPQKLIPWVIKLSHTDPEKTVNQITKEERMNLINIIKGFPLKFKKFRPIEEAIVTSGGVSTKEINPSTMESKLVPNLYFVGEVIDVDALTGGYNLQIAYSTGYLAGISI
ncbi:MAG: flavoprotein [Fusobacteria bacterium]|nr:MAG: flavoprotein [Fusobacteriota bacterium]KAF0229179.1 MAG: flavoprotein [Fusobacteriota bacterium]